MAPRDARACTHAARRSAGAPARSPRRASRRPAAACARNRLRFACPPSRLFDDYNSAWRRRARAISENFLGLGNSWRRPAALAPACGVVVVVDAALEFSGTRKFLAPVVVDAAGSRRVLRPTWEGHHASTWESTRGASWWRPSTWRSTRVASELGQSVNTHHEISVKFQ
ncbi:hypothetical protein M885DRAFT_295797 [Pelagophyceae sp. CCMP2097]|nr:hypothetical protein M885DRAFT_295797 [Pelagophyceae sp. CCMP2097]